MPRWSPSYHVACQIQKKILAKMGLTLQRANRVPQSSSEDCDLSPSELATMAKSWEVLEERKRILRMKGLPKPVDPDKAKEKRPLRAVFSE